MDIFLISNAVSLCLLGVFFAIARGTSGARGVFWLSAGLVLPLSLVAWVVLAMQVGVTAVLMLLCLPFKPKPKTIMLAAALAMVASYGILFSVKPELPEVLRLRREFPFESISGRLAYETEATTQPEILSPPVEARLTRAEEQTPDGHEWYYRRYWLKLLHSKTVGDFVIAPGNGNSRVPNLDKRVLRLPPTDSIPMPQMPTSYPSAKGEDDLEGQVADRSAEIDPVPSQRDLLALHVSGEENFLDVNRNGYVKDKDHVVGFSSHRFTKIPEFDVPKRQQPASWQIVRLELVSLLKHEIPAAYVSKNLPQMDELRDAPTRPLEEFERMSIDRLRSDEDVVVDEAPDRIRMVGSLRAARNCLACHSVRRGELLGALSYELVPVKPTRKKGMQVSPPTS